MTIVQMSESKFVFSPPSLMFDMVLYTVRMSKKEMCDVYTDLIEVLKFLRTIIEPPVYIELIGSFAERTQLSQLFNPNRDVDLLISPVLPTKNLSMHEELTFLQDEMERINRNIQNCRSSTSIKINCGTPFYEIMFNKIRCEIIVSMLTTDNRNSDQRAYLAFIHAADPSQRINRFGAKFEMGWSLSPDRPEDANLPSIVFTKPFIFKYCRNQLGKTISDVLDEIIVFLKYIFRSRAVNITSYELNILVFGPFVGDPPCAGQTFKHAMEFASSFFQSAQFRMSEVFIAHKKELMPIIECFVASFLAEANNEIAVAYKLFIDLCPLAEILHKYVQLQSSKS